QRGVPVAYLREVADHWAHRYDWRTWQTRLNEHPQLLTTLDGQPIHALHVRSPEPDALPLVVTHGWPGSVVEMLDVVGPLADPRRHGGDPADAFHVVVPSLPGFGFSTPLRETGWGHARIARAWAELMTRLGYQRFGAMGGDTGSIVSPELGRLAPDRVVGVHVHGGLTRPALLPDDVAALTPRERERLAVTERIWRDGTAYAAIQGTRPHTLAPALTDSPAGCSPGCSRSSGTGPTRPRRSRTTPSTSTTCSPTSPSTGSPAAPARPPSCTTRCAPPSRGPARARPSRPASRSSRPTPRSAASPSASTTSSTGPSTTAAGTSPPWKHPTSSSTTSAPSSEASARTLGSGGREPLHLRPDELDGLARREP